MPALRAPHPLRPVLAFIATLFAAPSARADGSLLTSTWSIETTAGLRASLETPELRALRQFEDELFGAGSPEPPEAYDPDCIYGLPDALSSDAPKGQVERPQGRVDLSFLSELRLPGLPVRWDSRVIDYLLFFKDDRRGHEMMAAWLTRMDRYGPMIRRVLAEHTLPQDLQIVAMIESGYNPEARSRANAVGMWQFVKQAGSYYGLRIDHWTDERMDPEASTRAAARYMRDLYDRFGNWELAFAAYNMGYGGLLRAVRKYNTNDYWLLSHLEAGLPYETSLYVAKITAAALIANNPEQFGFDGLSMEPTLEVERIDVPAGTPLGPIAAAAGIDRAQLARLNPHLTRGRVSPGTGHLNVYVPREQFGQFAARWSRNKEPAQHVSYVVRSGETFDDVARRHGVSATRLRDINHLATDAVVGAGFALIVPAVAELTTLNGLSAVATVPARTFQYKDRRRIFHRVASHDTAEAIARFFDVTVDELLSWNHFAESATLQRDMLVQLFVREDLDLGRAVVLTPEQVRFLTAGTDEFFDFHEAQRGRVRVRYRVQPGDTIAKIADRFELSTGSIGRINQFASNGELRADSWIVVYVPEKLVPRLENKGLVARVPTPATAREPGRAKGPPEPNESSDALPPPPDGPVFDRASSSATIPGDDVELGTDIEPSLSDDASETAIASPGDEPADPFDVAPAETTAPQRAPSRERTMKSVDEASTEILAAFEPVGVERVVLLDALGRFTSETVLARSALPSFDQSAMDGYAVRACELSHATHDCPAATTVRGESRAGGEPPAPLTAGCVMRVFTGAMLPHGADAVVLQEDTERDGDTLTVRCAPSRDAHVRRKGSDLEAGAVCCEAGSEIGSGEVGLLASQDVASISVWKRPRVAIICTGDELRDIGDPPRPGSIVSSNSYALAAQVREAGAEGWVLPTVRDHRGSAAHAIRNALCADVVVISGGVSVGDYDVVRDALCDAGVTLSFWKVRMKPGKPVAFGRHGRVPVLGLPGNPVSSWVTFELFVRPGLRKMMGANTPQRRRARVTLAAAIERTPGRDEFARARLTRLADGRLVAHLATGQGSGSLPSLVGIDALVVLPADSARLGPNEALQALILREPPGPES